MNSKKNKNHGFTIVEIAIIAPIVILVIGAFVATIISMTGETLATSASDSLSYSVHDALDRIRQDVESSGALLATNNISIESPQGYNDDSTNFHNADITNGTMLIINSYATDKNPLDTTTKKLYASGQPIMINIIYFVKNGTLWRRVLTPSTLDYISSDNLVPWQQPSCAPYITNISNTSCKAKDTRLVDGISDKDGFTVTYYQDAASSTINTLASDPNSTDTDRSSAITESDTIEVTINAIGTVAGRDINQSGSVKVSSPNDNTSLTPAGESPVILSQPSNRTDLASDTNITFTATAQGAAPITILWQQSTDQGASWTDIVGATTTTLTIPSITNTMDGYKYRAIFTNRIGSVTSAEARLTVNYLAWENLTLQNGWTTYDSVYSAPSYIKTSDGVVVLKGLIKNSNTSAEGKVIATLPVSYRPSATLVFPSSAYLNSYARIDVNSNGEIIYISGGSETWLSLENIRFIPDTGRYVRTAINSFLNGWSNFGSSFAPVSYVVDNSERVNIQGMMNIGTLTDDTPIFDMPTNLAPPQYLHIPAAGGIFGSFGITLEQILAKGSGSSGLSIQTMYYPATYNSWINLSLQSGWVAFGSGYSTPQYTKSADKLVSLKGLIKSGTTTSGTIIATLPAGYRPGARLLITGVSVHSYCRIDIDIDGNIILQAGGSSTWLALDNITFYAEK